MRLVLTALVVLALSAPAMAQDDAACSPFDAIYVPHPSADVDELRYSIDIEQNECTPPACSTALVRLTAFDRESDTRLSTLTMKYGCSGGSMSHCRVGFTTKVGDEKDFETISFDTVALREDFSITAFDGYKAPHVLVFPAMPVTFRYINWETFSRSIEYFTDDRVAPDTTAPEVWVLGGCKEQEQ